MKNWKVEFYREELALGYWIMRGWFGFQLFIFKVVISRESELERHEAEIALREAEIALQSKMDAAKDGDIVPMSRAEMKTYERMSRKNISDSS